MVEKISLGITLRNTMKNKIYKWKCVSCGCIPEEGWYYFPETKEKVDYFYCDNCVPRGCSCQKELKNGIDWKSEEATKSENYHDLLDKKGRKLPCVEFWFEKNEWEEKQRLLIKTEDAK